MKCRKRIRKLVRKCKKNNVLPSLDDILKHADLVLKESKNNRNELRKTLGKVADLVD